MKFKSFFKQNYQNIFIYIIKVFIFLTFLFSRSFMGINIFGFRIGEILIGFVTLFFLVYFFIAPLFLNKHLFNNKKITILSIFLVLTFLYRNFINDVEFTNTSIYQNSTYIWTFGAIAIGCILLKTNQILFKIVDIYLSLFGLFIIYVYTTGGISENTQNIFLNYTDKFEYPKGSDVLLASVVILYLVLFKLKFSNISLNIVIIYTALFVPLFLYKSRSGFFSILIFLIFVLNYFKNKKIKIDRSNKLTFVISIIIFLISTSWVVSRNIVLDSDITEELKFAITNRYSTIYDNKYEEEILELGLFYFRDNRVFSTDGNLNWRFQIWQDVFEDLFKSNELIFGYGFDDIIPAMDNDQRYGEDGLNIHVHNYFVHILSRGGLVHLGIILILYFVLYKIYKKQNYGNNFLMLSLPLLFNSLFDPSMENSHYPVILFLLLGLVFNNDKIFNEDLET